MEETEQGKDGMEENRREGCIANIRRRRGTSTLVVLHVETFLESVKFNSTFQLSMSYIEQHLTNHNHTTCTSMCRSPVSNVIYYGTDVSA